MPILFLLQSDDELIARDAGLGLFDAIGSTDKTAVRAATHTIAVLPFANMSPDPAQEYFSDGISEELLNLLARIPDLRVAARTS